MQTPKELKKQTTKTGAPTYLRPLNHSVSLDYSYFPFQRGRSLWLERNPCSPKEYHISRGTWQFQPATGEES